MFDIQFSSLQTKEQANIVKYSAQHRATILFAKLLGKVSHFALDKILENVRNRIIGATCTGLFWLN